MATASDRKAKAAAKKRKASLATRKFDYEDMINADPLCPKSALKVVRSYLPFVSNFDDDFAYRSIIDLQVDTSLRPQAIIDTRRALVELGHFVPEGKTGKGTERFRLSFQRENIVLDHKIIAAETLRRQDSERKERQRLKRQTGNPVTTETGVTEGPRACENRRDVTPVFTGEYLEHYLEGLGSEEEATSPKGSTSSNPNPLIVPSDLNSYAAARGGDPDHEPLPVPASEDQAVETVTAILADAGADRRVVFVAFDDLRDLLMDGKLTPAKMRRVLEEAA